MIPSALSHSGPPASRMKKVRRLAFSGAAWATLVRISAAAVGDSPTPEVSQIRGRLIRSIVRPRQDYARSPCGQKASTPTRYLERLNKSPGGTSQLAFPPISRATASVGAPHTDHSTLLLRSTSPALSFHTPSARPPFACWNWPEPRSHSKLRVSPPPPLPDRSTFSSPANSTTRRNMKPFSTPYPWLINHLPPQFLMACLTACCGSGCVLFHVDSQIADYPRLTLPSLCTECCSSGTTRVSLADS